MANRKYWTITLPLTFAILSTGALFAHETGKHLVGNVDSYNATSMTITTTSNETFTLKLVQKTRFVTRRGEPASRKDLKTGSRVVVHARQNGSDWEASEVDLSGGLTD